MTTLTCDVCGSFTMQENTVSVTLAYVSGSGKASAMIGDVCPHCAVRPLGELAETLSEGSSKWVESPARAAILRVSKVPEEAPAGPRFYYGPGGALGCETRVPNLTSEQPVTSGISEHYFGGLECYWVAESMEEKAALAIALAFGGQLVTTFGGEKGGETEGHGAEARREVHRAAAKLVSSQHSEAMGGGDDGEQ